MRIPAIRVKQWLDEWDDFRYDEASLQRKPEPHFYVCSIAAPLLRRLSGVKRREATGPRVADLGIQRGHDEVRSRAISRFVRAGYPWADLNTNQRDLFPNLRKPGWLPTSIVGNIVGASTDRYGASVDPDDLVSIEPSDGNLVYLNVPDKALDPAWSPATNCLEPIEIIDGQHRLYAFDEDTEIDGEFDFPVVLFHDLDVSWQAYLFWSINVSPRRIDRSLAYDLYPLLRTADWLEQVEGPITYRETRAQELTEALWSHPDSPWEKRIGMLGRERGKVTQAAFIRSLTHSFVRGWSSSRRTGIGGFFGTELSDERSDVLQWTRAQQAAYLISLWSNIEREIADSDYEWAANVREKTPAHDQPLGHDAAFAGRYSILATDQGVRGVLQVSNDLSYQSRNEIPFGRWERTTSSSGVDIQEVSASLEHLNQQIEIAAFIKSLAHGISSFDWRSAAIPGLPDDIVSFQSRFRAGSGYRQVRLQLLNHFVTVGDPTFSERAQAVQRALRYRQE